jgi:dinuclear metal center YbgI/SA1388 family protein
MKIAEITSFLESLAPVQWQEDYDNSGLIVGRPSDEVNKALLSLDCTEAVVDEAIRTGCDLIISHHPIVFKGMKRFNEASYIERVIAKAIKNNIALYSIHTNLDNVIDGVNREIMDRLGVREPSILAPKDNLLKKLSVFVPEDAAPVVRDALFAAGAGNIGNYSECSYNLSGLGTFLPSPEANPTIGRNGVREEVREISIEVIYPKHLERKILIAMFESHPYEEVAHNIYPLDNAYQHVGSGMIGNLPEPLDIPRFLRFVKEKMQVSVIRHTADIGRKIQRVAVCGGSGSFLLSRAIRAGADAFISSDFKYHEFFDAEEKILITDIGHYESEQFTPSLLLKKIQNKFPNFVVRTTIENTNPVKYYF